MDITTSKARIIELSEINAKDVVIVRKVNGTKKDYKDANWNVLEDKVKDVKINIETMKESSQKSNEKHRWIPNTGEYLKLSDIRVIIKTEMGIELVKKITKDTPVLLLDDVLSELDSNRQNYLLNSIGDIQTIITCTGLDEFVNHRFEINKVFKVTNGIVEEAIK